MKHLRDLFSSLDWWRLRPDQDALVDQPGRESPDRFIAAARSESGDAFLAYIPEGGKIVIKMDRFKSGVAAHWFNPATGGAFFDRQDFEPGNSRVRGGGRQGLGPAAEGCEVARCYRVRVGKSVSSCL